MTSDYNSNIVLCGKIAELRRAAGMTQDALAEKLGVTFQAVSKWENALSCPDIALIPVIADIFGVSIDTLFGKDAPKTAIPSELPWENDGKLYAVLFHGTRLVTKQEYTNEKMNVTVNIHGSVCDMISDFNVSCDNVTGDLRAGSVSCDTVQSENVSAGTITCHSIEGSVFSNAISSHYISGDAITNSGKIQCDKIEGNATGAIISCQEIMGGVSVQNGTFKCEGNIGGNLSVIGENAETVLECGDIKWATSIACFTNAGCNF